MSAAGHARKEPSGKALAFLSLAALGVVYGDIGTSPLYALKECFTGTHAIALSKANVLGVLSLIFWSLNFVVTFKYLSLVMRADNRGEGGILSLLALARPSGDPNRKYRLLIAAGLFGSALLYGDGIITPAISVLSAVEGLRIATPAFDRWIIPIALVIISALFAVQRRGTAGVGKIFGPITATWFVCIALLGIRGIVGHPDVLAAVNPLHAAAFFAREGWAGVTILGAVVLVVTGGEALYADMGHFGRRPIRLAWYLVVLPALSLNYFGQGALLLERSAAVTNPFYELVPSWALYPMVVVATCAAIVASQALISGAFSLTRQAVQLGFCPRMNIVHTSGEQIGQIYVPQVNLFLWIACIGLVLSFGSASALAATYGVAVTGTMTITSILFAVVARRRWGWAIWKVTALTALFLVVDLAFFGANLLKVPHGGWFPLLVAGIVFLLMSSWKKGRVRLSAIVQENTLPLDLFLKDIAARKPLRVPGAAVFLTSVPGGAPPVLLHHLKHNKVLHQTVVLMSIATEEIPQVDPADRVRCRELGEGFYEVIAKFGFMETPDVPSVLASLGRLGSAETGTVIKPMETTYYLGRETLIAFGKGKAPGGPATRVEMMPKWRKQLFILMSRNAQPATAFFGLPPNRVVELGAQLQF